ncbi:LytTR family transcriptional regulator DNA-binding domain-containing protein [Macrococcus capreoli]
MTNLVDSLNALKLSSHCCVVANTNQQHDIISYFAHKDAWIEDFSTPFHERLYVKEQLKFYMKWFNHMEDIHRILKQFGLLDAQHIKIKKLDYDQYVLLKVAVAYLQDKDIVVFKNILHNLKVETIDCILNVIPLFNEHHKVLQLLSYIDHALLLSNEVYQVKKEQMKLLEIHAEAPDETLSVTQAINTDATNTMNDLTSGEPNVSLLNENHNNISREINRQLTRNNVFRISVKSEDKTLFINPEDIDYIEGADGKVNIYLNNASFKADYTLSELEEKLKVYGFYRCHRSYIINLQKVTEMITWSKNSYSIKFDGLENTFVPLSRTKVKEMQGFFNNQMVQFTEN